MINLASRRTIVCCAIGCLALSVKATSAISAPAVSAGSQLGGGSAANNKTLPTLNPADRPYSPEELRELRSFLKDAANFRVAADAYRTTINNLVRRSYDLKRKTLMSGYESKIRVEESEERTRRIAAITLFEDFLRRYPRDTRWTPDVIFRLAELYFEKSNDEYLQATDLYEKQLKQFERGELAQAPAPPKQNYQQTIDLHRRLIKDFPKYRLVDGAYYLLGFCLAEMGEIELGNQAFLSLVCHNKHTPPLESLPQVAPVEPPPVAEAKGKARPVTAAVEPAKPVLQSDLYDGCKPMLAKSIFNPESWIRVGEYHFDENQLEAAIAAYRKVLDLGPKGNAYYDEALYKLAWTFYRADRYAEAIKHFDNLVVYSDKEYERTGKYGSEMRPESIQYLAISFAEEDWNGDTIPDPDSGLARAEKFYAGRENEKHVYEVYHRLGNIFFDTTKYEESMAVYKLVLKRWPYHADNPDVQDKVILAMERLRKFDEAIAEREEFTRLFGKGTEWERRNRDNHKALKKAREYDEQALIQAAVFHHKQGQELKKRGLAMADVSLLAQAAKEYELAAKAYQRYLDRFPESKNSYEIRYSYASALYYSQRFLEAAAAFAAVRDSNLDNRYQEEAAFSSTKAYEEFINQQVRDNKLPNPELPKADSPPAALVKIAMPEVYKQWQDSLDAYAKILPNSPKTARLTYKAAEISYRFLDFTDSRKRFAAIYDRYCKDPMAITAGQAILVTYQLEKNLDQMENWATKLKTGKCGAGEGATVVAGATQLLEGIKFKRAEALMKDKKWDKAAAAYLALVAGNPKSDDADKALNNAAVAYENSKRFESATKIYERIWRDYPNSPLAHEALWRSAINYQRFFSFKQAVNNYLILADSPKFESSSHRNDSVYNAAVILENDQDYGRAAQLFLRYAKTIGKPKEAAEATFRAGTIYEKMGDTANMTRIFNDFPKYHGAAPDQGARSVEAVYRLAKAAQKRGDTNGSRRYWQQTINEFNARQQAPGSDAAEFAASASFQMVEVKLKDFLKQRIRPNLNALPGEKAKMANQAVKLKGEYERVFAFKRQNWTLAAMERSGEVYEHFARVYGEGFRNAPIPTQVRRLGQEAIDLYQGQLDEKLAAEVQPIEENAKKLYGQCVEKAKEFGVSNTYTEEALRRLAALDPTVKVQKRAKVQVVLE